MNKTKNYALNQWGPTDPIRRQDFNRDNAVLDAALAQAAEREMCTTLQEVTLTEKASQYTLDLSDVDWSAWRCVVLETDIRPEFGGSGPDVRPNGVSDGSYWTPGATSWTSGAMGKVSLYYKCAVVLFPLKSAARAVTCTCISDGFYLGTCSKKYADLTSVAFVPPSGNTSFLAGSTFRLLGIR